MKIFYPVQLAFVVAYVIWLTGLSCNEGKTSRTSDSLTLRENIPPSPVFSPGESIKKMHIQEGFEVRLVAAEPLVTAPVAMSFDKDGRIWVVQMNDYMPDTLGSGEEKPTGKIVILNDTNADGVMDERKIFLDSLVLPRAICLLEDGILVAEPPTLWFYKIEHDKPGKKVLVDSAYAQGGNVEHQPNGLLRALDNWIYNAKSNKRYRKKGNKWLVEKTHFRGQWGITQDEWGRLFYNTNSDNILGDEFSPGLGATNANQKRVTGFNKKIVTDDKVYPVRPTTAVNRGYAKGTLDDSLRLLNFTAACGPVIYDADLFSKEYDGNAFLAEPAANLIKRNVLTDSGYRIEGRQAYKGKEFLASEDERFRPVNLCVGPDGALYVVDMYRGIIQHKTYLTTYLKSEIKKRDLTQPLTCGRIYKIVPRNKKTQNVQFTNDAKSLLQLLQHPNADVRNQAQQLLIDGRYKEGVPELRSLLQQKGHPLTVTHALWTMEGLEVLTTGDVLPLLQEKNWPLRMQALSVLPSVMNKKNYQQVLPVLQQMIDANDTLALPYIGYLVHYIQPLNASIAKQFLVSLTKNYGNNLYVADAVISNLQNQEESFYKEALRINGDTSLVINKRLKKLIADIASAKNQASAESVKKRFPKGAEIYQSICQTCHGTDGNGTPSLAPPLNGSEWVTGDENKLISIVLYGLTGPVQVNGKLYKTPDVSGDMPGIGQNPEFGNGEVAQIINYVRNSWKNKAGEVNAEDVNKVKSKNAGRQNAFTAEELKKQ